MVPTQGGSVFFVCTKFEADSCLSSKVSDFLYRTNVAAVSFCYAADSNVLELLGSSSSVARFV